MSDKIEIKGLGVIKPHKCIRKTSDGKQCMHDAVSQELCEFHFNVCVEEMKRANDLIEKQKKEQQEEAERISKLKVESVNEYEEKKKEFLKKYFKVGDKFWKKLSNDEFQIFSKNEIKDDISNWMISSIDDRGKMTEKHFIDLFMKDKKEDGWYERVDFEPNVKECSPDVYNLFQGFEAEKLSSKFLDMNMTKSKQLSKPIIQLFYYLTGGHSDYMMKCLGAIIQTPWIKTEIANYIRDEGELTRSGGGVGKNLAFDFFGRKILGDKYYYVVSDNSELYGSFNGMFEGKLLILVEEANGTDNLKNSAGLKSRISKKKITVNKKGKDQYQLNDYTNYVFTTNQINAIPIQKEDRRFVVYDADTSMRGNKQYFKNLVKEMEKEEVIYSFYYYLKNIETYDNPVDFRDSMPITNAYRDIRRMNTPIILRWLSNLETLNKVIKENKGNDLYDNYSNILI